LLSVLAATDQDKMSQALKLDPTLKPSLDIETYASFVAGTAAPGFSVSFGMIAIV
jgi:hypothetical protein